MYVHFVRTHYKMYPHAHPLRPGAFFFAWIASIVPVTFADRFDTALPLRLEQKEKAWLPYPSFGVSYHLFRGGGHDKPNPG